MPDGVAGVGRDWLSVVRRRGWIIAEVTAVVVLASILAGRLQPEVFETHSELAIYTRQKSATTSGAGETETSISPETEVRALRSPEALERIADAAGLAKNPGAVDFLAARLDPRITSSKDTEAIVWIYVTDGNPQRAADIADAAATTLVSKCTADATSSTQYALDQTTKLLDTTEKKLSESEDWVKRFKQTGSPVATSDDAGGSTRVGNYTSVEGSIANLRVEIATTQRELAHVKQLLPSEPKLREQKTTVRNPLGESLRQQIMTLEMQRAVMLREFTPSSEEVQAVDHQLTELRRALKEEKQQVTDQIAEHPNEIYESLRQKRVQLEQQLTGLQARQRALNDLLARRQQEVRTLPADQTEMTRMLREQRVQEQLYTMLLTRKYQMEIEKEARPKAAELLQKATVSAVPVRPNRKLYVAIGLVFGILLGLIAAGLVDQLDDTFGDAGETERHLGVPVLGDIPVTPEQSLPLPQIHAPTSAFAEAMRGVVAAMQAAWGEKPPRIVLVTGPSRQEGRSLIAANMAAALAETGRKVILVDGDLRSPLIHEYFGLARSPGLSDALAQDQPLEDLVQTAVSNLWVLTSGTESQNPGGLLGSQRARDVWQPISELADVVIVDTPPALALPDTRMMAAAADAAILVLTRGTKRHAAHDLVTILGRSGTEVLGCVRNRERTARLPAMLPPTSGAMAE